jgi:SNF2 family DNA or RNA helicase
VTLNLLAPEKFPSQTHFRRRYLMQNGSGSYTRVAPGAADEFKRVIKPLVLRREKEDIYKELPKFNRLFTTITIDEERLKKAYNAVIDEIEGKMFQKSNLSYFDSIGELQKLRQICGLAKVNFVADYAETFVSDSEKAKLAIGYHHHAVRDSLWYKLEKFGVCKLDGQDSPQQKDYIAHKYFEKSDKQIILLGEQACKEGIELVYIDYALMTERQWTSTDEEQFEFRFFNPDLDFLKSRGLENKVTTVEYIIAKNTIDQFFGDLVEEKRAIFGETISNNWSLDQDAGAFRELLDRTVASRL